MRHTISLLVIVMILFSCNSKKQTDTKTAQGSTAKEPTTTVANSPDDIIKGIDAEVSRINALSLTPKKFDVVCDEKATVSYFRENDKIVKVSVDWNMVGDFATIDDYYYKNQKLIYSHESTSGGVGNEPTKNFEFKSYVDNDKTIRYLDSNKVVPCTVCDYSDTLREYAVLKADNVKDVTSAVCR